MSLCDILVHLDERASSKVRALAAVSLAKRLDAPLSGVFLKADLIRDYVAGMALAGMSPVGIDAALKEHAVQVASAERKARRWLEQAALDAGLPFDWLTIEGDDDQDMVACARRFDLTILPSLARVAPGPHCVSAPAVGLASGGPILVIPERLASPVVGERVLIAWKGTRESARALHDAAPLLRGASEVHVLTVARDPQDGESGLLDRHLERMGVHARLIDERRGDHAAPRLIRQYVKSLKIDLLVMGLYGRPRVQELILGGVSDDLVNAPPCATLASH